MRAESKLIIPILLIVVFSIAIMDNINYKNRATGSSVMDGYCVDTDLGAEDYKNKGTCTAFNSVKIDKCSPANRKILLESSCESNRCEYNQIDCTHYGWDRCYHGECVNNEDI